MNKGITIEQVEKASKELMKSVGFKRNDFDAHKHNVLVQGINRDGKLRLTLIDM